MATPKAAWGIEIGAYAIKAIRLERDGDNVRVSDFAVIPHKKVLTTPDLDQDEMVRLGLGQFISQKSLEGEHLVMSVPGHSAFARFAKLPPVEPKKVPDIVKFEAVQQIPFPIDEVEWDYQTFTSPDTPEIEVGIFAITRERVQQRLGLYGELGVSPEAMTLSPVAVYNAMAYDLADAAKGAVLYLDIGTSATDVIVSEAGRCWIRTFPLGGTHFTEAIASAFKLSYSKAEKLKLEASDSKYAKQIMQAMRPVFSDLLQDLQRSIGYYQSLHRESELKTMVGIGSTFKIPGLRKFLGQQLQIDVVRLDEYKRIAVSGREAASFAENAVNMATAYGLALQGVGLAPIDANLVPIKSLREQMWAAKTKWFAAAAAIVIAGSGMLLVRPMLDGSKVAPVEPTVVSNAANRAESLKREFETVRSESNIGSAADNILALFDNRSVWSHLLQDSSRALATTNPQPELLGSDPMAILQIAPKERRLVQLTGLESNYLPPGDGRPTRRISVRMNVELSHDRPGEFLNQTVAQWLRSNAEPSGDRADVPYRIIASSVSPNTTAIQEVLVTEEGEQAKTQGSPTASGAPSDTLFPPSGYQQPPSQPSGGGFRGGAGGMRGGPPQGGGTFSSPGGGGGDVAGGVGGASGGTYADPGGSAPPGGFGGPGSIAPPPTTISTPSGEAKDLNALAPAPKKPRLYPPNSKYFRAVVSFEVELLGDAPPAPAEGQGEAS